MQANTRNDAHEAILAAHTVAYNAASLFTEHHKLKDGKGYYDPEPLVSRGYPVVHGVIGSSLEFIPLSTLMVGGKLKTRCQCSMKEMSVSEIRKLLNTSFVANKDWRIRDVRVSVKKFMEPILEYLTKYKDHVEAYVSVYENKSTYTDVLGIIIASKEGGFERLTWEITIDDIELVPPMSVRGMFCRN